MNDNVPLNFGLSNVETLCRICLTQSKQVHSLKSRLCGEEGPLIKDAWAMVMCTTLHLRPKYPNQICNLCLGALKISYELKLQFETSESTLNDLFGIDPPPVTKKIKADITPDITPVEIIVGTNTYDLKDLLIIEDKSEDETPAYQGFLNNLGKTITASYVTKSNKSVKNYNNEKPRISIEKKAQNYEMDSVYLINIDSIEDAEEPIQMENESTAATYEILNTVQFDLDVDLQKLPEDERKLFQSASNMQFKCNNCDKVYSINRRYKKHIEQCGKVKDTVKDNNIIPNLTCPLCDKAFSRKKYLNFHVKTLHNTIYSCDICNIRLPSRSRYLYHKKIKHCEPKYVCDLCGKRFFSSSALQNHTSSHSANKTAQCICPVCGKTFHYKGGLFYHMKIHTNERKYCCEFCDRRFYSIGAKKRHILTHTGERPYSCIYCGKRFFSRSEIRKHELSHTGYRPHRCQFCKKGFLTKYHLKQHLLSYPGKIQCTMCDKGFISHDILRLHCKLKHKEDIGIECSD